MRRLQKGPISLSYSYLSLDYKIKKHHSLNYFLLSNQQNTQNVFVVKLNVPNKMAYRALSFELDSRKSLSMRRDIRCVGLRSLWSSDTWALQNPSRGKNQLPQQHVCSQKSIRVTAWAFPTCLHGLSHWHIMLQKMFYGHMQWWKPQSWRWG